MKTIKIISLSVFVVLLSSFSYILIKKWSIIPEEYSIEFSTEKAKGTISGLKGDIIFDPIKLSESSFRVSVDVNTISLGFFLKTTHAKADDFLNVKEYPNITFSSKRIFKRNNTYIVEGELAIKEHTKTVSIPFEFNANDNTPSFVGTLQINRLDFGLNNKRGVGEKIDIKIKVPVK